jgi:hypothetical protein
MSNVLVRFLATAGAAVALAEEIDSSGEKTDNDRAADPCRGRLVDLTAECAELGRGEVSAGGETVSRGVRQFTGSFGQRVLGGVGKEISNILPEQGNILADA